MRLPRMGVTMTDLEMTRLCAEAMGLVVTEAGERSPWNNAPLQWPCYGLNRQFYCGVAEWRPLHDDAQAMALVKTLRLTVEYQGLPSGFNWHAMGTMVSSNADLNRAIVECVAKMQMARSSS